MARKIVSRQALRKNVHRKNTASPSQQALLAGLGAGSGAQSGSGKIADLLGNQAQVLVAEGRKFEARVKAGVARKAREIQAVAKSKTKSALKSISGMEGVFEAHVSRMLNTFGIPTGRQVRALTMRMEEVQAGLDHLTGART